MAVPQPIRPGVSQEELDTRLKGVATKGDIKIVVDRIQAVESKVDAIMDFLIKRFGMPTR